MNEAEGKQRDVTAGFASLRLQEDRYFWELGTVDLNISGYKMI